MPTSFYFDIQRFSTHDGEGIRTVLFLKGCPLSCIWCQNPESRSRNVDLMYEATTCINGCTLCQDRCSAIKRHGSSELLIDHQQLNQFDINNLKTCCPAKALRVVGEPVDIQSVCEQLKRDKPFYTSSGGGVTFSGGEPLIHPHCVYSIAQKMQEENINVAIETTLHVSWKKIEQNMPVINQWLVDLKHMDDKKFKQWTGGTLSLVKNNLVKLADQVKDLTIRVPVIPDFNDSLEELALITDFAARLSNCKAIHFLPYHTLGIQKYKMLGLSYQGKDKSLDNPELLQKTCEYAEHHPLKQLQTSVRG
ncbi:glycyl-radical enzyme activating protein [Zooshikella marina]|uniref:glycyl-radical enzyme activating protein n=1 Tax=Zooshikella ganghwensis TaxID=202772 RepID=UPI001BAF4DC9|nr:glycyl-radical enzyme activating protein [Zooshikella ganghwensis]MBU2704904.1 glycyl-radical enzyme activating protein [Zooshikella ganghwensis]